MKKENFQYTIVINQKTLMEIAPTISMDEAGLLNYLIQFKNSNNEAIREKMEGDYTWINYKKILHDMPLLRGKSTASVGNRIKRLEELELIETINKHVGGLPRKYFKILPKCEGLYFNEGDPINMNYYNAFIGMGMNEDQAKEVASDFEFLKAAKTQVDKVINSRVEIENKGGYIWEIYKNDFYHGL